jgi:tRNA threonylcarbamoyladenosine biosynthesis protein TsaB
VNTLSFNTSTNHYSLAVMNDEILVGEYTLASGSHHFSNLMPSLDELLNKVGLGLENLDGLIVALGPGSFTGIRIGLSVVKGLSQCLGIPVVGVSTLLGLASQVPYCNYDICPLVASRREEVFIARFRWDLQGQLIRHHDDTCVKISELESIIGNRTVFVGNNFPQQGPIIKDLLGPKALLVPPYLWNLRASSLVLAGLQRLKEGDSDGSSELVPIYLRDADIRPPKAL